MRFSCVITVQTFALRISERDLPLPAPLESALFPQLEGSCDDLWLVLIESREVSATIPDQQMQLKLSKVYSLLLSPGSVSGSSASAKYVCGQKATSTGCLGQDL